jgi:hypothetical protein
LSKRLTLGQGDMSDIKVYAIWVGDEKDGDWLRDMHGPEVSHSLSKGLLKDFLRRTNRTDERFRIAVVNDDGRPEFEKAVSV